MDKNISSRVESKNNVEMRTKDSDPTWYIRKKYQYLINYLKLFLFARAVFLKISAQKGAKFG